MKSKRLPKTAEREVPVSNQDKIFYPKTGFTKGEVIEYYRSISPVLLPHLKGRAITLKRYPNGVDGSFFYEKQCPSHAPAWIKTTPVERADGTVIDYCLLDDLPPLLWAVNLANLEIHPFMHRASAPTHPTALVFDLDPGPPADVLQCAQVAIWIRDLFDRLGLKSLVKTSGSKGLQLIVPLNNRSTYATTKPFAQAVAAALSYQFPDLVTDAMKKCQRSGKVFIDWSQNDDKKTTVGVYSLRAKDRPFVSTPLTWIELEEALRRKAPQRLVFLASDVLKRVSRHGDLYSDALTLKQKLPAVEALLP